MAAITIAPVTLPNWHGPSTGVTIRFFVDTSFVASDGTLIQAGAVLNNTFYESYACSVSGTNITFPSTGSITLDSTTDGQDRTTSLYSAYFFDSTNALIGPYDGFVGFRVFPTPTSTTWAEIKVYNSPVAPVPIDLTTLSATQIAALISQAINDMMGGSAGILGLPAGGTGANLTTGAGVFTKTASGSTAVTLKALSDFELLVSKGAASGYCPLNASTRIDLVYGGTNANLSATGPGFLKQATTGANVTVAALAANDVPNLEALNGLLTPDKGGTGIGTTPAANSVLNGNGSAYTNTTTPTIGGLTTANQAAIGIGPFNTGAGQTGELRWKTLAANNKYTFFKAPDSISGASFGYVLPNAQGGASTMLSNDGAGNLSWVSPPGAGSGYNTIQEEGVDLAQQTTLNIIGAALTAADTGSKTNLTLSQSPGTGTSVVDTDRTISTTAPLSGGGDLSADRTIAIAISPALDTTVVGTARTISTTAPLSGGGDLSADRTLAIAISPALDTTVVGTARALSSPGGTISGVGTLAADLALDVVADKTNQRVAIKDTSAATIGTRPTLQLNDTATLQWTITDNNPSNKIEIQGDVVTSSANHNLLSATHPDTAPGSPVRGDLIVATSAPAWAKKALGSANTVLRSDGSDPNWSQVALATDVTGLLPAINGGTGGATALAGFNNLSPLTTAADLLTHDGVNNIRLPKGNPGQMLRVNLAGTALEYADAAGGGTVSSVTINSTAPGADNSYLDIQNPTSAPVVSLLANPNCASDKEAALILPTLLPGGTISSASFGANIIYIARVFVPYKIKFNRFAVSIISTATFNMSIGIYSPNGVNNLVNTGVRTVTGPSISSLALASGTAVTGGNAILPPGHYIYAWTQSTAISYATVAIGTSGGFPALFSAGGTTGTIAGNAFASNAQAGTAASTVLPSSLGSITSLTGTLILQYLATKLYSV